MYSINGRTLHEGHAGWRILRSGTNTQGGISNTLNKVPAPGRNGYVPAPHTFTEQIVVFVVRTPRERLDELLALCASATTLTRTADATKMLRVELASAIPAGAAPFDATFDVAITLSAYEGVWRDTDLVTVGPVTVASPSQTLYMLNDLSAPILDHDIFLRGVFGQMVLLDSGGSWLKTARAWPGSSTTGLLFVSSSKQAFVANESSPWVPVSDASQYVDVSGNGGFQLTPELVSGNPADRRVKLTLTTLTQTSTTIRVRARRSYRMN
jgi:hypothetical protein